MSLNSDQFASVKGISRDVHFRGLLGDDNHQSVEILENMELKRVKRNINVPGHNPYKQYGEGSPRMKQ